jgi:hypothetical protein
MPYRKSLAYRKSLDQVAHQAFFTREAVSTICETTINGVNEFSAGKIMSNEIKLS